MVKFCPHCNREEKAEIDSATGGILCTACGTLLGYSAAALPAGTMVAGFRIENEIGRGGMGVVYRATQLNLQRPIALKVLSDELSSDSAFVETFFHEARSAASLSHPNIVQAYDAGVTREGIYYFAMEYIDGETLEVKLSRSGPLSPPSAFQIGRKIADALGYAWKVRRMCHGDIKPDNILVSVAGEIKLADLGLAKSMYEESVKRDVMVTPLYAAPEIICGKVTSANLASDIYSFGATLYHITVGSPPFQSDRIDEIYRRHLSELPVPPSERNREVPEALSAAILAMLEKDPGKRPVSWEEVSAMLGEAQDAYQLQHTAVNAGAPVSRALIATGIVLVLLLIAGGVVTALHFFSPGAPVVERGGEKLEAPPPLLLPQGEDPAKLNARLRKKWEQLKKELPSRTPEGRLRACSAFMEQNNLQESLLREVQEMMGRARLEIRARRKAAAAYRREIAVFLSLSRFAIYLDSDSLRSLERLASGIGKRGKLPHLRRVYAGKAREFRSVLVLLRMRRMRLNENGALPYPVSPGKGKNLSRNEKSAKAVSGKGWNLSRSGRTSPEKSHQGAGSGSKINVSSVKTAEEELINIIARQVRDFSPDVLRMQLSGFARKYHSREKASAEKAELIAKMLLDGDALTAFFSRCNESLKGIPLPEIEQNASYVVVKRGSLRIMVVDGRMTIRKRIRLNTALLNALKHAVYRAYRNDLFRKRYSAELQEFVIVNSFFYDNANAGRNIALSTLPEKRKILLREILADIGKAVKRVTTPSSGRNDASRE